MARIGSTTTTRRAGAAGALAIACGLVALAAVPGRAAAPPLGPCAHAPTQGTYPATLTSGGLERPALVHVPPAPAGRRLPVLVALHGAGQDRSFFERYTGYSVIADGERFIAVYPNALPPGHLALWTLNDDRVGEPDDVAFISDLLDEVAATQCVDPARVYATGVSNGAGMAARLGCQLSTRIAAIAPVAGGYGSLPACHPVRPVSVLEVHGTYDGTVPYQGDALDGAGAVGPYLRAWARRDACRGTPSGHRLAPRVLRLVWSHCAEGTSVAHLEIVDGGHQLPGALPPDRGQVSTISAPWLAWSFLRGHMLARPYPTRPGALQGPTGPTGATGPGGAG